MRLYIMRHGHAVLPLSAQSDEQRELTAEGEQEVAASARWLAAEVDGLDACFVSPYIRAQQSAAVALTFIDTDHRADLRELTPDTEPAKTLAALVAELSGSDAEVNRKKVLLVSHMPLVSYLVHEIDRAKQPPIFPTGAIAVLDFDPQTLRGSFKQLKAAERVAS